MLRREWRGYSWSTGDGCGAAVSYLCRICRNSTVPQLQEWQEHSQLLARYYIDVGRDKGRPLTVELNSGAGHLLAALRGSQPRSV